MARAPIEMTLDGIAWTACPPRDDIPPDNAMPYATHEGVLRIPGLPDLRCYQLSDGRRIVAADDVQAWFGEGVSDA